MRAVKNVLVAIEWMVAVAIVALGVTYGTATLTAPGHTTPNPLAAHLAQANASMEIFCDANHLGAPSVWAEHGEVYGACAQAGNAVVPVAPAPDWASNRTAEDVKADQ